MTNTKRILALILCLVLCLASLPVSAFAEEACAESSPISLEPMQNAKEGDDDDPIHGEIGIEEVDEDDWNTPIASGTCGDNLTWALYDTGRLKIKGTGAMWSFDSGSAPWYAVRNSILTVVFGSDVTGLGSYAFFGCGALTGVTIPAGVTSIGCGAFADCPSLLRIEVSADNSAYADIDGVLFNKGGKILIAAPGGMQGAYLIPSGVKTVEAAAFYGCGELTGVTVPVTVKSIGDHAFCDCGKLKDVYYEGIKAQWNTLMSGVGIGNEPLINATLHLPHVHTYAAAWTYDDAYHWHAATCEHTTEVSGKATHDWDVGVVTKAATHLEEGVMTYTCTVCRATRTETIPMLPVPGDLNNDGVMDSADVLLLMDYVKARGVGIRLSVSGDLNNDGKVNNADILRLMSYL